MATLVVTEGPGGSIMSGRTQFCMRVYVRVWMFECMCVYVMQMDGWIDGQADVSRYVMYRQVYVYVMGYVCMPRPLTYPAACLHAYLLPTCTYIQVHIGFFSKGKKVHVGVGARDNTQTTTAIADAVLQSGARGTRNCKDDGDGYGDGDENRNEDKKTGDWVCGDVAQVLMQYVVCWKMPQYG